jgi:hypothetical protein
MLRATQRIFDMDLADLLRQRAPRSFGTAPGIPKHVRVDLALFELADEYACFIAVFGPQVVR